LRHWGHVPRAAGQLVLWAYLLIAFGMLSVRLAVIALEATRRRKWMPLAHRVPGDIEIRGDCGNRGSRPLRGGALG
jgi:hypothetical protein